jgi:hypothetical protein
MMILTHRLWFRTEDGERPMDIRIQQPVPADRSWPCKYDLDWPEGANSHAADGFDALPSWFSPSK